MSGTTERVDYKGQRLRVNFGDEEHANIRGVHVMHVEDYWDTLTGGSWGNANGNPAALFYAMRAGFLGLPWDDEVLYGHDVETHLGHIFHVNEIVGPDES